MPSHHGEASGSSHSGVAGGMRRRPIDVQKRLPLIRSTKELALDDDTKVDGEPVRGLTIFFPPCIPARAS